MITATFIDGPLKGETRALEDRFLREPFVALKPPPPPSIARPYSEYDRIPTTHIETVQYRASHWVSRGPIGASGPATYTYEFSVSPSTKRADAVVAGEYITVKWGGSTWGGRVQDFVTYLNWTMLFFPHIDGPVSVPRSTIVEVRP